MRLFPLAVALAMLPSAASFADQPAYTPTDAAGVVEVTLKDHRFTPSEIHVPAGQPAQVLVKNEDGTADEFDSSALKVEKMIGGGSQGVVWLRPLEKGRYTFMGEFHPETAQGVVIAE